MFLLYATLLPNPAVLSTLFGPLGGFPGEPFQRSRRPARESVELSRRILRASLRNITRKTWRAGIALRRFVLTSALFSVLYTDRPGNRNRHFARGRSQLMRIPQGRRHKDILACRP